MNVNSHSSETGKCPKLAKGGIQQRRKTIRNSKMVVDHYFSVANYQIEM